ncbi:MAG: hypothetical protein NTZ48_03550, partial [Candidatus Omnitrophica bacterium]|nr:hypothetical protein [Candidatus Omnitrophota bacterium]
TSFILKLRGINELPLDNSGLLEAKGILQVTRLLAKLRQDYGIKIRCLYQGLKLCHHITVYNPPVVPEKVLHIGYRKPAQIINELKNNSYSAANAWLAEKDLALIRPMILEGGDYELPKLFAEHDKDMFIRRQRFIAGLINKLSQPIQEFLKKPSNLSFNRLFSRLKLSSNNASVVFKYSHNERNILFTGDAGLKVFRRLIKSRQNLRADVLKIPHHGSQYNMNRSTLKQIAPKVAIVSHGNRKFGRASDSLPNLKIINLLDSMKIETIYTNDVIKRNGRMKTKPNNRACYPGIEYLG